MLPTRTRSVLKNISKVLFTLLIVSSFSLPCFAAGYTALSPVPGLTKAESGSSMDLGPYMKKLYNFLIGAAAALAVIMVIWGGVEYMTTDAIGHQEEGKQKIQNAILGLLLALSSYIILQTINRDLLNLNFDPKLEKIDSKLLTPDKNYVLQDPVEYATQASVGTPSAAFLQSYKGGAVYNGQVIKANNIALDTDGVFNPGWDPDHLGETSYAGLNAFTDPYVALPTSMKVKPGTPVLITDHTTGKTVQAIHGDNGATGVGEMSAAAAQALGIWNPSMKNSIDQSHDISFTIGTSQ
ncbi:MAG: pilin [Candidatus Paceibacterota bacterium]|jgi:hypothetical protein